MKHDTPVDIEGGHGRHEERGVTVLYDPDGLPAEWVGAKAVVQVCRERVVDGVRTSTTHYSLTSHAGRAGELAGFLRGHWGIESMHWVLDVVFGEDDSRVRERHAGANLAMIRRGAVSLLRRTPGRKTGATTPTKRKRAGWDDDFLLQVLQGITD